MQITLQKSHLPEAGRVNILSDGSFGQRLSPDPKDTMFTIAVQSSVDCKDNICVYKGEMDHNISNKQWYSNI